MKLRHAAALALLSLSVIFVSVPVMALTGDDCIKMSDRMRIIAKARDAGVSSDKAREAIDAGPESAKARTIEDVMVTLAYGSPELTPDKLAAQALQACLIKATGK